MSDVHAKPHHDYHLVDPSPWPAAAATAAFFLAAGGIIWMKHLAFGAFKPEGLVFGAAVIALLFVAGSWWVDVIKESNSGYHTRIVQIGLRYGMILFIASEVMFFVAWFWAFFNTSLFPPSRSSTCARTLSAEPGRRRASRRSIPGICRCSTR